MAADMRKSEILALVKGLGLPDDVVTQAYNNFDKVRQRDSAWMQKRPATLVGSLVYSVAKDLSKKNLSNYITQREIAERLGTTEGGIRGVSTYIDDVLNPKPRPKEIRTWERQPYNVKFVEDNKENLAYVLHGLKRKEEFKPGELTSAVNKGFADKVITISSLVLLASPEALFEVGVVEKAQVGKKDVYRVSETVRNILTD